MMDLNTCKTLFNIVKESYENYTNLTCSEVTSSYHILNNFIKNKTKINNKYEIYLKELQREFLNFTHGTNVNENDFFLTKRLISKDSNLQFTEAKFLFRNNKKRKGKLYLFGFNLCTKNDFSVRDIKRKLDKVDTNFITEEFAKNHFIFVCFGDIKPYLSLNLWKNTTQSKYGIWTYHLIYIQNNGKSIISDSFSVISFKHLMKRREKSFIARQYINFKKNIPNDIKYYLRGIFEENTQNFRDVFSFDLKFYENSCEKSFNNSSSLEISNSNYDNYNNDQYNNKYTPLSNDNKYNHQYINGYPTPQMELFTDNDPMKIIEYVSDNIDSFCIDNSYDHDYHHYNGIIPVGPNSFNDYNSSPVLERNEINATDNLKKDESDPISKITSDDTDNNNPKSYNYEDSLMKYSLKMNEINNDKKESPVDKFNGSINGNNDNVFSMNNSFNMDDETKMDIKDDIEFQNSFPMKIKEENSRDNKTNNNFYTCQEKCSMENKESNYEKIENELEEKKIESTGNFINNESSIPNDKYLEKKIQYHWDNIIKLIDQLKLKNQFNEHSKLSSLLKIVSKNNDSVNYIIYNNISV